MQPLLTIAIPTYNRKDALEECLKRVFEQVEGYDIEIVVSDNASDDGTYEYCNHLQEKGFIFSYYRNITNLGPDNNFLNCFAKAKGKYTWLLSDDDFILPGAIGAVIDSLINNPCFLHLNSCSLQNGKMMRYGRPRFQFTKNQIYMDRNDFFSIIGIYLTFVSSLIFRTEFVREIKSKDSYINSFFLQSHLAFETMKHSGPYVIVSHNCLTASLNATVGYDLYYVWFSQYRKLLSHAIECGFNKSTVDKISHDSVRDTVLSFVKTFRIACRKQSNSWDKTCIKGFLDDFPDLRKRIIFFVNCPIFVLKIYKLAGNLSRPIRMCLNLQRKSSVK